MSTSPAAHRARLKVAYGPQWHISASIPGTGPRTITAIETTTGRRLQARGEPEMETKLMHARRRPQPQQTSRPEAGRQPGDYPVTDLGVAVCTACSALMVTPVRRWG